MDESNDLHVFGSVHIYALLEEDLEELEVEQDRDSSDGEEEILITATASNGSIPHQPAENRCHISNMDLIQHVEQLMDQLSLRSFTTDEDIRACTKILSKVNRHVFEDQKTQTVMTSFFFRESIMNTLTVVAIMFMHVVLHILHNM